MNQEILTNGVNFIEVVDNYYFGDYFYENYRSYYNEVLGVKDDYVRIHQLIEDSGVPFMDIYNYSDWDITFLYDLSYYATV